MRIFSTAFSIALLASAGFATAQTSAPAPKAAPSATSPSPTMAAPAKPAMSADKAAKSKQCSTEADAKGLHGKARKKFREECKSGK